MGTLQALLHIFQVGGPVMWPLLLLSVASLAMCFERAVFWLRLHTPSRARRNAMLASCLRAGDLAGARSLAHADRTVYGWFASQVLGDGTAPVVHSEAAMRELVEEARPVLERFSVLLSTIITAAPLLGILGTVTGIIKSFGLLGGRDAVSDPNLVADGIAQALYTTAFGLIVALSTLFPYVIYRAQADRAFTRLETLGAAAAESGDSSGVSRSLPAT
jgi:biopolymer transport protein ExbB